MLKFILSILVILVSSPALAGQERGGGFAVACFSDSRIADRVSANHGRVEDSDLAAITSIEMLDLLEWRLPRGLDDKPNLPLATPKAGENYQEFWTRIAGRLEESIFVNSPEALASLGNYLCAVHVSLESQPDHVLWTGSSLVNVEDTGTPISFGGNCTLVPMAVQEGTNDTDLRIFIDNRLFFHPKHSVQSQAALFLHESIYSMARALGQTDSSATREAVGWIMQNDPRKSIGNVQYELDRIGFSSGLVALRNSPPTARLAVLSELDESISEVIGRTNTFWLDYSFRAKPTSRSQRDVLNDMLSILGKTALPKADLQVMNFNTALGTLKELGPDLASPVLAAEAQEIVEAKVLKLAELLDSTIVSNHFASNLDSFSYLSDTDKLELRTFGKKFIFNEIMSMAKICLDQYHHDVLAQVDKNSFGVITYDDLLSTRREDGKLNSSFLWISAKAGVSTDYYTSVKNSPDNILMPQL